MTTRPFYLNWISVNDVLRKIHELELIEEERNQLMEYVMTTIHYEVLDAVLGLIPEDEHDVLLVNMQQHTNPHKVFEPHEVSVEIVETVVRRRGEQVISQIHEVLIQGNG